MIERAPGNDGLPQPNGHSVRSAETRSRMIAAAIEVFGRLGYEAATTRELAKGAKVNLSAILYHFGGKRELYLAAAQVIADHTRRLLDAFAVPLDSPSSVGVASRLEEVLLDFLRLILDESDPKSWTMYLARCATEDDEAFQLIYDRAFAPLHERLVRAVQTLVGEAVNEDEIRLRVSSIMAALISFRLLRGFVLRGADGKALRARDKLRMETMVRNLVRSDLLIGGETSSIVQSSPRHRLRNA